MLNVVLSQKPLYQGDSIFVRSAENTSGGECIALEETRAYYLDRVYFLYSVELNRFRKTILKLIIEIVRISIEEILRDRCIANQFRPDTFSFF